MTRFILLALPLALAACGACDPARITCDPATGICTCERPTGTIPAAERDHGDRPEATRPETPETPGDGEGGGEDGGGDGGHEPEHPRGI
jgi:hypothetical protein